MTPNLLSGILGAAKGFFTGGPIGAIAGGIGGLTKGGQNVGGNPVGDGGAGADALSSQKQMQDKMLAQQSQMQTLAAEFQGQMSALKIVSESLNAGNDARNKAADKIGSAGR